MNWQGKAGSRRGGDDAKTGNGLEIGAALALPLPALSVLKPTAALARLERRGCDPDYGLERLERVSVQQQCGGRGGKCHIRPRFRPASRRIRLHRERRLLERSRGCHPPAYPSGTAPPPEPDPGGSPLATLPTTSERRPAGLSTGGRQVLQDIRPQRACRPTLHQSVSLSTKLAVRERRHGADFDLRSLAGPEVRVCWM